MSENDFENESNVALTEPPPAEKPEKPARKPRKTKAEKAAEEAAASEQVAASSEQVAELSEQLAASGEQAAEAEPMSVVSDNGDGNGAEVAVEARPKRGDQTQAAETLDIRMLKEMKLPDLTKL